MSILKKLPILLAVLFGCGLTLIVLLQSSFDSVTSITGTISTVEPTPTPEAVPTSGAPTGFYCDRVGVLDPVNPFRGWPSVDPTFHSNVYITATFCDPFYTYGWEHEGIDMAIYFGSDVVSLADTLAVAAGFDPVMGNYVQLCTGSPSGWCMRYMHLSNISISAWDTVSRGQVVGQVGSTGSGADGVHLHYDIVAPYGFVDPKPTLNR